MSAQEYQARQPVTFHDPASIEQIKADVRSGDYEDRLPQKGNVEEAATCEVINAEKQSIPFSSLYERKGDSKRQRHLFIFVRHFFCGLCQDYIRELTRLLPPSSLPSNTQISIIGCGSEDLIPIYAEATECPYPLYADPSKQLYDTFTMGRNLSMGDRKPDYQTRSHINLVLDSLVQSLRSGLKVFSGGAYSQLGGEMLFEDGEVVWCHRMRNTRDHTEVPILKKVLEMS